MDTNDEVLELATEVISELLMISKELIIKLCFTKKNTMRDQTTEDYQWLSNLKKKKNQKKCRQA